jgi:hypothetical protein
MKTKILLSVLAAAAALPLSAKILFISHNTPASEAVTKLVVAEYNYANDYPAWWAEQLAAGESNSYTTFQETSLFLDETEIPDFETLLANRLAELGLAPDEPADAGFTKLLESKGFEVVRSTGQEIAEPDTANGETAFDNIQYAVELTPEVTAELNAYDLIIMSRDIASGFAYSLQGRLEGQEGALTRIKAWNNLTAPIIVMHPTLPTGSEFDFRWGWSYGFSFMNPSTVLPYVTNKDTNETVDPLTFVQEIHDPTDPVFEGIDLPGDGIINIYDETIFRSSVIRKFENNENYQFGLAVKEVLEYVVPNFIATDGTGNTLDIETKDPIILRLTPRRSLFTLQANVSDPLNKFGEEVSSGDLIQRVIGPRLYFAAGMHDHGIYNLNEIGEKMFLNAVMEHDEPSQVVEPESLWKDVVAANALGDKQAGIGWINDVAYPFIWHYSTGGWMYVLDEFSALDNIFLYDYISGNWFWANDAWGGWHVNLEDGEYGLAGWADWTP